MSRIARIHPFLYLAASLIFFYRSTAVIASPDQVIRPAIFLFALLLLLEYPARWLAGGWDGGALLLLIFVLGICSIWQFFLAAGLSIAAALATGLLIARVRSIRVKLFHANGLVALIGVILLFAYGLPLAQILPSAAEIPVAPASPRADLKPAVSSPDIYYIILDGYARADILSELYQVDTSDFIGSLESIGFVVPTQNHSNYPKTALSVSSTLNMEYIDAFAPGLADYSFWWMMSPAMDHSRVRTLLEEMGYTSVSVTSDWSITDNPTTDVYYSPAQIVLSDYENHLLFRTPLGMLRPVLAKFTYAASFDTHRDLVRFQFDTLAKIPAEAGPKFVITHIIAPHPPFVFDADGNPLQPDYPFSFNDANDFPGSDSDYRLGYGEQVQYINRHLLETIDIILRDSATPPIIILQADHGPGMFTDFNSAESTCLAERFSPFAAYYLPGADPHTIPDTITPVNLFRIIFNQYFSGEFPLLENKQFYTSGVFLFQQEDVTAIVDTCTLPK